MGKLRSIMAGIASIAMIGGASAVSANPATISAENIRKLHIMLMVTSLRCRDGEHDFQAEYQLFTAAHQHNLTYARNHLERQMSARYNARDRERALDRLGVGIANTYGEGHPWLGCADLKRATLELSMSQDRQHLTNMADLLLAQSNPDAAILAQNDAAPATEPGEQVKPETQDPANIPWWLRG